MENYNLKNHRQGKIWTAIALVVMAAVPALSAIVMGTGPDWGILVAAWAMLTAQNLPVALGEVFLYSPMLGTNGTYLAFVTGNLSNLKIPCVINAINIAETKPNTEETELVSTISIAVSAIVTILIIAIGVVLLATSGLSTYFESEQAAFLKPAFGTVAFALFGALGGKYLVKYPKIALWPFVGMTVLCIILVLVGQSGLVSENYMLFVGVIACFFNAKRLYYKKCKEEAAAEAAAELDVSPAEVIAVELQADVAPTLEEKLDEIDLTDKK